jgi:hypothetical protein
MSRYGRAGSTAPRTITARYPGTCGACGNAFPAGARITYAGKGSVKHDGCSFDPLVQEMRERDARPLNPWTNPVRAYQAPRGRCEDAPACGCCD